MSTRSRKGRFRDEGWEGLRATRAARSPPRGVRRGMSHELSLALRPRSRGGYARLGPGRLITSQRLSRRRPLSSFSTGGYTCHADLAKQRMARRFVACLETKTPVAACVGQAPRLRRRTAAGGSGLRLQSCIGWPERSLRQEACRSSRRQREAASYNISREAPRSLRRVPYGRESPPPILGAKRFAAARTLTIIGGLSRAR